MSKTFNWKTTLSPHPPWNQVKESVGETGKEISEFHTYLMFGKITVCSASALHFDKVIPFWALAYLHSAPIVRPPKLLVLWVYFLLTLFFSKKLLDERISVSFNTGTPCESYLPLQSCLDYQVRTYYSNEWLVETNIQSDVTSSW